MALTIKTKEATMTAKKLKKSVDVEKSMTPERLIGTLGASVDACK